MTAEFLFERNWQALQEAAPRTAAWLAGRTRRPAGIDAADARSAIECPSDLGPEHVLIVYGIGDGSDIAKLLDCHPAVVVVESSAAACSEAFNRIDFSAALAACRLRILAVSALNATTLTISMRECMDELVAQLHRPGCKLRFLASREDDFFRALRRGAEDAARKVETFASARSAAPVFDVTVIGPVCAIFDDLAHCFGRLGLKVHLLRVPDRRGVWSAEEVRTAQLGLASRPSRLVVTRNRTLFETDLPTDYPQSEALIPGQVAMWWWDVPNVATHIELRHPRGNARTFAFARDILARLPEGAEWLPAGARTPFVEAGTQPAPEPDLGVSFVGQSRIGMLHANLVSLRGVLRDLGADASALERDLEAFCSYEALHAYLAEHYLDLGTAIAGARAAFPAHAYYLQYLLDMAVTAAFRIAAIERLLKEGIDLALYGDDAWLKVPGVTAANFHGVCPHEMLPLLYRRSLINLNLNFMQVSSTVNPKVLDIAAAGAVALTDERPELALLYPDAQARPFVFRSLDDLTETVLDLKQSDLTRHREAVRAHTRAHHTLQHRAQSLAERFGLVPGA